MRISDWSSDVCSSDLTADVAAIVAAPVPAHAPIAAGSTGNPAPDEAAKVLAAPPLPATAILPIVDQGAKPKTSEDRASSGGKATPLPPVAPGDPAIPATTMEKNGRASSRERVCKHV